MSQKIKPGKALRVDTIMKSEPFKRGVADYNRGVWSADRYTGDRDRWRGRIAGQIYELGRMTALVASGRPVTEHHCQTAVTECWPPSA